jgi:hypothetical protein
MSASASKVDRFTGRVDVRFVPIANFGRQCVPGTMDGVKY